jgi:hypothetical protein
MKVQKVNDEFMKNIGDLSLESELQSLSKLDLNKIAYQSLSTEQIDILAKKISYLPARYNNLLFYRYCFNNNFSELNEFFQIDSSELELLYIKKMLSSYMSLNNSWIYEKSMKEACQLALKDSMKEYDNIEISEESNNSNIDINKLTSNKIKKNSKNVFVLIAKSAAALILVCFLGFSSIVVVNAEVREKLVSWIVEVFPKYSSFKSKSEDKDNTKVDLKSLKINYVPNGFELIEINELRNMLIYNYLSENDEELIIKFLYPNKKSYFNTENAVVKELVFKDQQSFLWETDEVINFIWHQDGMDCSIFASLSIGKDEVIKIAENIKK